MGAARPSTTPPCGDGRLHYHTGAATLQALDADTGKPAWEYRLSPDEGDCFNPGTVDKDGNLYTISGGGVVFKFAPDGRVLWRREVSMPELSSPTTDGRVELDAWGNVCATPNTQAFHVYSPEGLPLLRMEGKDAFDGSPYVFDFTLSEDRTRAYIKTCKNFDDGKRWEHLVEVTLPGSATALLESLPDDSRQVGDVRVEPERIWLDGIELDRS